MNKIYAIGALTIALVLGGGWLLNRPDAPALTLPGAVQAQDATTEQAPVADEVVIDTSTIQDMVQGSPDAPVEIIEYGSFTCRTAPRSMPTSTGRSGPTTSRPAKSASSFAKCISTASACGRR